VRLLLDTQIAIWWQISAKSISHEALTLVQEAEEVFISRASLWEMAIKCAMGKLHIDLPRFAQQSESAGFNWLDINNQHILHLAELPLHDDHKDPFDRLLISQSLSEPMIFVTTDKKLARYGQSVRLV
jgi:PIN domain nuclease of toxin-antitoxin system